MKVSYICQHLLSFSINLMKTRQPWWKTSKVKNLWKIWQLSLKVILTFNITGNAAICLGVGGNIDNRVVYKLLRCFWDPPKRPKLVRFFSKADLKEGSECYKNVKTYLLCFLIQFWTKWYMITYIFLLVYGVDLLFKIHRAFLLHTRERAVVLLVKPPGTESVKKACHFTDFLIG